MDERQTIERLRERIESLERTASLGFLLSAVVHEVNNPLSVILIGADTLRRKAEQNEYVDRHLDVLEAQSTKIIDINKLLQGLSKRNLGELQRVDAAELVGAFAEVEVLLGGEAFRPQMDLQDAPLPVKVDLQQTLQVLRLLARSARDLGGDGVLRVRVDRQEISLIELPSIQNSPTREFVVFCLVVGAPTGPPVAVADWIGDFFDSQPTDRTVELMASWEVVRKLPGRLRIVAGAAGAELQLMVPVLGEDAR